MATLNPQILKEKVIIYMREKERKKELAHAAAAQRRHGFIALHLAREKKKESAGVRCVCGAGMMACHAFVACVALRVRWRRRRRWLACICCERKKKKDSAFLLTE
jgi:hypothetical protein